MTRRVVMECGREADVLDQLQRGGEIALQVDVN